MEFANQEELFKALQAEVARRQKEERLRFWNQVDGKRHLKQAEAMASQKRILGIFGGNRSGKTVFGSVRTALFVLGASAEPYIQDWLEEDKKWWYDFFGQMQDPIEAWAGTVNWDVHRDITQPELLKWIPKPILAKSDVVYRRKDVIDFIRFPNGSRLTFKSYDSGREAFQGKSLFYLWLDEEPDLPIWNESKQRLMDQKGHACLTMTPLKGLTWAYTEVYMNDGNDQEVASWHFTWDDNPWLDEGEKNRMLASMTEDEIAARKFGEFLAAGSSVLSKARLMERRRQLKENPPVVHRMEWNGQVWVPDPNGPLEIYEKPKPGKFYILGADTAEGLPSGDNSVGSVIEAGSAKQVAEFAVRADPTIFGVMLYELGKMYNWALIAPERNNTGHATISKLDEMLYPALYRHNVPEYNGDDRLGWRTDPVTRPLLVRFMQDYVRDAVETVRSLALVEEGLTFVRNDRGRAEAAGKGKAGGRKDDRLFAWGIALALREVFGPPLSPVKPKAPEPPKEPVNDPWKEKDKDEDRMKSSFARWDPSAFVNFDNS